jgi:starch synthase
MVPVIPSVNASPARPRAPEEVTLKLSQRDPSTYARDDRMRVLMISAEGPPMQRAGALVDVLDALPHELRERGHEVSLVLPFYREIRKNRRMEAEDTGVTVDIRVGEKNHVAEIFEGRTASGVQEFFVRCDEFFDRPEIYGEHGVPYEDNAARFIFFNKAAIELARRLTPAPQVLHVHDWAAALIPAYVHAHNLPFATVLTIHRLEEQGIFWGLDFALTNLPQRFFSLRGVEFFGRLNFLKGGIVFADRITTVSEHYKHEILRPEGGHELDAVLRENAHKLRGILHGADYTRWNPEADSLLPARFIPEKLWGKLICRDALLADLQLAPAPRGPVFGMVTRVVAEKGFGILTPLFDRMLCDDVRLIILGEGDPAFETTLAIASRRYPARFAYRRHFDETLAHLIEAGSDVTLVPSRFEPGGLMAMYSLRYGAIPIAHATGGIHEIVQDYDPTLNPSEAGYGFLCYDYSSEAFWDAIKRARVLFRDRATWVGLIRRAMAREFSWSTSAERYEELYRGLVGETELAA